MSSKKYEKLNFIHELGIDPDRRIVYLMGDINTENASKFIKNFNYLLMSEGDINVLIMSGGGSWSDGMAMYQIVKQTKNVKTTGVAMGECSSMGSIILQAFDARLSVPDTTFLIHPGSADTDGEAFVRNFINKGKYEEDVLERMYEIYYERAGEKSGMSYKKFKEYFSVDRYLGTEEALELGLIDEITGDRK